MRIDILTVMPDMVRGALGHGIVGRAMDAGIVDIRVTDIRDFARGRHRSTDDTPYGGGGGMVMLVEPVARALANVTGVEPGPAPDTMRARFAAGEAPRVVLMDPRGDRFTQQTARAWAGEERIVLVCGRYEGVDERIRTLLATDEASIGDYVLSGGELPALVIADAITRLQPGALGDEAAAENDTFSAGLLEYPHYTRPRTFRGSAVPDVLLCGHAARIAEWRRWQALRATRERRPDLLAADGLGDADQRLLDGPEPAPSEEWLQRERKPRRPPT